MTEKTYTIIGVFIIIIIMGWASYYYFISPMWAPDSNQVTMPFKYASPKVSTMAEGEVRFVGRHLVKIDLDRKIWLESEEPTSSKEDVLKQLKSDGYYHSPEDLEHYIKIKRVNGYYEVEAVSGCFKEFEWKPSRLYSNIKYVKVSKFNVIDKVNVFVGMLD